MATIAGAVPDAEYVCTLTDKSIKKAKEELNEEPKDRLGAVETFRQWIVQQPHIKCPTDIGFLLPFLRTRYFSQLEARKLLENFLSKQAKNAQWFKNLDPADPKIQAVMDSGFYLMLPDKDDEGRQVMIVRPGWMEPGSGKYSKDDVFRAAACAIFYMYLIDEDTTVNGTVSIVDFGRYSMKTHSYFSLDERKEFFQTWQSNFPARVKQMHMYNNGAMTEILMTIIRFCMPEKIQQRLKIHGQVLESVYKDIPMRILPAEYLPDDYKGPNAGTEKQIIERMKSLLTRPEVRARIQYLSSDQFRIDDKKKSDSVPVGSFRKLNVD